MLQEFQSTPSAGRATRYYFASFTSCARFQSTPSAGRATHPSCPNAVPDEPFQSTPSAGRATISSRVHNCRCKFNFNPRPPQGGRLQLYKEVRHIKALLSTPSAGRATMLRPSGVILRSISIHALRREGDKGNIIRIPSYHISIHALRREGDNIHLLFRWFCYLFQSTPSAGRATRSVLAVLGCGGGISIHALRREGDKILAFFSLSHFLFQSTPSAGRATRRRFPFHFFLSLFQSTPSAGRATPVLI